MVNKTKTFQACESYKHKFAKQLLYKWLKESTFGCSKWDGDGVHLEYPLCPNKDGGGFNYHNGTPDYEYYSKVKFSPSYNYCVKNNNIPIKVADIASVYEGQIQCIFEIYHTHRVETTKVIQLKKKFPSMNIYELCADKILNLTSKPGNILDLCEVLEVPTPLKFINEYVKYDVPRFDKEGYEHVREIKSINHIIRTRIMSDVKFYEPEEYED